MLRRRLAALVAAFALAVSINGPALAVSSRPVAKEPIQVADGGVCQLNNEHAWAGETKDPNYNVDGVSAVIYTPNKLRYYPCTYAQGNDGPASWVALLPGSTSKYYGDPNKIIQFGVVACNDYLNPGHFCTKDSFGAPQLHYVVAYAGCGIFLPNYVDLGLASYGTSHTFQISHNTTTNNDKYNFWLDGVQVAHIADTALEIQCWANPAGGDYAGLRAEWQVEKVDYGDSAGTVSVDTVEWSSAQFRKTSTQVWTNPSWPVNGSVCSVNTRPSGTGHYSCFHYVNNQMTIYTTF